MTLASASFMTQDDHSAAENDSSCALDDSPWPALSPETVDGLALNSARTEFLDSTVNSVRTESAPVAGAMKWTLS